MQTEPRGAGGAIPRPLFRAWRRFIVPGLLLFVTAVPAPADMVELSGVVGRASWYGHEFAFRRTASGQPFDPYKLTGAHRTLPFGSKVLVTNLHNGRSVLITITDRGPYMPHRDIDLSYGAARALGMVQRGIARVRLDLLES